MRERALTRSEQQKRAAIVGGFVIFTIIFLFVTVMWIKNYSLRPAYSFFVQYEEPPYITKGAAAYFRGMKVGKVGDVQLSPDNRAVNVRLDIEKDSLKLPTNTEISVHTEGITGVVYLMISYPTEAPPSSQYIADGMVVRGVEPFSWDKVQRYLTKLTEDDKLDTMMNDILSFVSEGKVFLKETREAVKNTDHFMKQAARTAEHSQLAIADIRTLTQHATHTVDQNSPIINETLLGYRKSANGLNQLLGTSNKFLSGANGKQFGSTIQEVGQSVKTAMDNWGAASAQVGQTFSYVQGELEQTGVIRKVSEGAVKVNTVGQQAENLLTGFNQSPDARKSLLGLGSSLQNTSTRIQQATSRFDCIQTGVAQILNQRFVLLKLLFGRPGKQLDACVGPTGPIMQSVSEKPSALPKSSDSLLLNPNLQLTSPQCIPTSESETLPVQETPVP